MRNNKTPRNTNTNGCALSNKSSANILNTIMINDTPGKVQSLLPTIITTTPTSNVVLGTAVNDLSRTKSNENMLGTSHYKTAVNFVEPDIDIMSNSNEEEIMGEIGKGRKSDAIEKNLNQMVNVLHSRLSSLENAAKTRLKLCEDDINAYSKKMSRDAPKIVDEFDEVIPRSLKDFKQTGLSGHRDNLVSSDVVFIDPNHLVLKTKPSTDTAKKLEAELDDSFGVLNIRELKSKKTKSHSEKSKKSEKRKKNAQKLEKQLQGNMDSFLTRSVMEAEYEFKTPERINEEADWPISIKWSNKDPRSHRIENSEGQLDPDALLQYGLERINLPSGRNIFSWLIRQTMVHRYLVGLFWFVKVKFFEHTENAVKESYLLRLMSLEYKILMDLLGKRSKAEHEKDFVYRFYPFILTNAVYYGFFYLFPGSRHLYTKGFKKTLYMQVMQLLYGIQVCSTHVKVSWAKLFPEDMHDDEGGGEAGESFPVLIAFNRTSPEKLTDTNVIGFDGSKSSALSPMDEQGGITSFDVMESSSGVLSHHASSNHNSIKVKKGGFLLGEETESKDVPENYSHSELMIGQNSEGIIHASPSLLNRTSSTSLALPKRTKSLSFAPNDFQSKGMEAKYSATIPSPIEHAKNDTWDDIFGDLSASNPDNVKRIDTNTHSFFEGASKLGYIKSQNKVKAVDYSNKVTQQSLLARTYLKPMIERPNAKFMVTRQNNFDTLNPKDVSPQVQLYLSTMEAPSVNISSFLPNMRRTIPISWCPAGGSETHRKRTTNTDLHDDIAKQAEESMNEFAQQNYLFHKRKIRELKKLDVRFSKVISSGPTSVSRYSLDLVRRQKEKKATGIIKESPTHIEDVNLAEIIQLATYDDKELDRFLSEL